MIKERIIKLVEFKQVGKEYFFKKIGVTSANFRGSAGKTPVNSNTIENIFTEFPDLNLEWLITGKGEMLKSNHANSKIQLVDNNFLLDRIENLAIKNNNLEKEIAILKKSKKSNAKPYVEDDINISVAAEPKIQ